MRGFKVAVLGLSVTLASFFISSNRAVSAQNPSPKIGERPTLEQHINEADIEGGLIKFKDLIEMGESILAEAIMHHAGEARPHRQRFSALTQDQKGEIIEFLKQLQVLPNGSPREVTEDQLKKLVKSQKGVSRSVLDQM